MSFFSCVSADCIILLDYQASCWSLYEFRKRGSSTEGGNLWLFGRMSFQMRCSGIYIYSRNMWSVVSYNVSLHKTHVVPHGQFFLWRFSLVSSLFRIMSQRKKMTLFGSGSSWRYIWIARDDAWMNDEIICRLGGVITSYHCVSIPRDRFPFLYLLKFILISLKSFSWQLKLSKAMLGNHNQDLGPVLPLCHKIISLQYDDDIIFFSQSWSTCK
jgi:hypothetical protein